MIKEHKDALPFVAIPEELEQLRGHEEPVWEQVSPLLVVD